MNYFEIINAVLLELNYEQVSDFANLTKNEHSRIKHYVNMLNKEVCQLNESFYFRQMIKEMKISKDNNAYPIRFSGKIDKIIGNNTEYICEKDYSKFYSNSASVNSYSIYGDKLLVPFVDDELKIFYFSDMFVKDASGELKYDFENATDKSIIPENFVEKIFINGVAYLFKQNTSHPKYLHWKQEYEKALKDLLCDAKRNSSLNLSLDGGFRKL